MKINNNNGVVLAEYILTLLAIAIMTIVIVVALGDYIKDGLTRTSCYIGGADYIEGDTRGKAVCQK